MTIQDLLRETVERGASDLHIVAGSIPRLRLRGHLQEIEGQPVLDEASILALLEPVVAAENWSSYRASGDLDYALAIDGLARFRVNYFRQARGSGAVFRVIPEKIQSLEELGLPKSVAALADVRSGLVLVTGPTGSGKSTTLAAIIDRINSNYSRHIVTIEDPVEFIHPQKRSFLSQRAVGHDTESMAAALRSTIRQDADVVLVGELRDLETISLALKAAEMGILVFGTLHTNSASKTIDRLIDVFPTEEQSQARISLSESLGAIVAQQLIRRADGSGRVAALEVLIRTPGLPNIIREGSVSMLTTMMQGGKGLGMQTLDDSLANLVAKGVIELHEAHSRAQDRARLDKLLAEAQNPPGTASPIPAN
jgi:twitching motility protein PilT